MTSDYYADKLRRRKPVAFIGCLVTALGTASFGSATAAQHVLMARAFAWIGRGVRTPVREALLAGSVTKETYGRAFGFERMMDTLGAIVGPASAFFLLGAFNQHCPSLIAITLIPSLIALGLIAFAVKENGGSPQERYWSRACHQYGFSRSNMEADASDNDTGGLSAIDPPEALVHLGDVTVINEPTGSARLRQGIR